MINSNSFFRCRLLYESVSYLTLLYDLCFIIIIKLTKDTRRRVWRGRDYMGRDTEYRECQAFFPFVRIGSRRPPVPLGSVAPPPLDPRGETHSLAGVGVGRSPIVRCIDFLILQQEQGYSKSRISSNSRNVLQQQECQQLQGASNFRVPSTAGSQQ
jgi:hypothetical protein